MRALKKYMLVFFTLLFPAVSFADDLGLARINLIDGDVQVMIQDTTDWTPATINLPMNEGDRLWSPEASRAELQIRGGVSARIDADTALDILTVTADSAQFYLDRGHVYINNRRGGIRTSQVDTPLVSIRSYDNSIMMIDITEDGVTEISVLKGSAYAESRAGATQVIAGNTLTIRDANADMAPLGAPDDWERWNTDRDRLLTSWGESSRYLPDELHEYSSDFDANGHWDYAADYGYVWTPIVTEADWAPYSYGQWVWIRGNYVWISHHTWGWAPTHYGRWVTVASHGWCWVPPVRGAVYWGPGYVGWVVTPTYVAWVPLAPGEIYYGYGYYGPWSMNVMTINIQTVVINRPYVNARVRHGVNAAQRDSFGTGRRIPVQIRDNPFADGRGPGHAIIPPREKPPKPITFARPGAAEQSHIQPPPQRERVRQQRTGPQVTTPSVVTRPREQRFPPDRVRNNRPQEMKNERRLVRERDASVFKQQQPENLPVTRKREPKVIIRKPAIQQPGAQQQKRPEGNRTERRPER